MRESNCGAAFNRYLPKDDYVIQLWCGGYDYWISDLLRKGYRVIFSNSDAWYLGRYTCCFQCIFLNL